MKPFDEATRDQHRAADPGMSTWLSANAGSGKTRVLTDRVARLLLGGVEPQKILCLTYTKAAATEMQNRLFQRLGGWSMLQDDDLRAALLQLGETGPFTDASIKRARTLFARAIETPGGLKIQTIHSFCAGLLRRFPLEAGVSPQFTEIEERAADMLRGEIVDWMADGADRDLVTDLARNLTQQDFRAVTAEIVKHRARLRHPPAQADLYRILGIPDGLTETDLEQRVFAPGDEAMLRGILPALDAGSKTDAESARKLRACFPLGVAQLPDLEEVFLFKSGAKSHEAKIDSFPTKGTRDIIDAHMPRLNQLMQRVADARDLRYALETVRQTRALHGFAERFISLYEEEKQKLGWLDFDDLIEKCRNLLNDPAVAAWVLYRLDGGINHILVDEAQDTSPNQWDVIAKLAEEFASGRGAREDVDRTIFVVGDRKQSIYSFQGADPREFERMRQDFETRLNAAGRDLAQRTLDYSFRSSPAVLKVVDSVFDPGRRPEFGVESHHLAFHDALPGRVDLWPVVEGAEKVDDPPWEDPVDRPSPEHHVTRLAKAIAAQIDTMIGSEDLPAEVIGSGLITGRKVRAGDFLILVQRRSGIFDPIIRACKERGLPVAGADRLRVGGEVAVKDILALLSFLATPEDSLSLATALRSPLFRWSEGDLFELAHHRTQEHLWQALRAQEKRYSKTVSVLRELRDSLDFLRPYDLIERILTRHDGRRWLIGRLGAEAEDGIDALLSQALAYERSAVPSLTGFLTWMESGEVMIKRQIDSASDQIRVMTTHGAKGLEAPIVILPDCGPYRSPAQSALIQVGDDPIWRAPSGEQPAAVRKAIAHANAERDAEKMRLLYVALTRAEKWLIVAASGKPDSKGNDWHQMVAAGMRSIRAQPLETPVGEGLRFAHGDWRFDLPEEPAGPQPDAAPLEPWFAHPAARRADVAPVAAPSDLGGAKALPGEGLDTDTALAYGALVHELLEHGRPGDKSGVAARARTAAPGALVGPLVEQAVAEAAAVLDNPAFADVFSTETLAEVSVAAPLGQGRMLGAIDRLIVTPERVIAIDFKTNRVVPGTPDACPEGLLRQMGAYAQALALIYPDRAIGTAILWSRSGHLMRLPHDIVTEALARAPYLDDPGAAS